MPFTGTTSALIFDAILNQTPTAPVRLNPDLPPQLEEIIDKPLEKDRELRYQTASDLRADLKRLKRDTDSNRLATTAEVAEEPSKPVVKPPLLKRHGLALTAAVAVLLLVAVLIWKWVPLFPGRSPAAGVPRALAVVEIENLSQDSSIEWLEQGVAELLTTNLAQAKRLVVISTDRVRGLIGQRTKEGGKLPPGEAEKVAKEAHADLFLSGTLLKVGSRLRLDLRVQETDTGKVLFADKVEGEDCPSSFRAWWTKRPAGIVEQLVPGEIQHKLDVAASLTSNLEALRAYEEGRSYFDRNMGPEAISRLPAGHGA